MRKTGLCYIGCGEYLLLLYRNKKKNDPNAGKWLGIGGGMEAGETPEQCTCREVEEETGLKLSTLEYRGIIRFISDCWEEEEMHLFTSELPEGTLPALPECNEGELKWVQKKEANALPMWEGDKIFFDLLEKGEPFFHLTLRYVGERLAEAGLNGKPIQ